MTSMRNRQGDPTWVQLSDNHGFHLDRDFLHRVSLGQEPGVTRVVGLGFNPDVDLSTLPESIWTEGGLYPWFNTATSFSLKGYDAADTYGTGLGAWAVTVSGLAPVTYAPLSVEYHLDGINLVPIAEQFIAINNLRVTQASLDGDGLNVAKVELVKTTGGAVQAAILAGVGISQQAAYTVPAGYTLLVLQLESAINASNGDRHVDVATYFRSLTTGAAVLPRLISANDSSIPTSVRPMLAIPVFQKNRFDLRSIAVTVVTDTKVSGLWEGLLFKNPT